MFDKIKSLFDIKMWKFLLVGVLNTLVGQGLSFLLLNVIEWEAFGAGTVSYFGTTEWDVFLCSGISTILASIMSYFLNRYFTFQYKGTDKTVIIRFAVNIAVCYGLAYGIAVPAVKLLLSNLSRDFRTNFAMVVGMCLFVGFNYLGQRFFTFREEKEETENPENKD